MTNTWIGLIRGIGPQTHSKMPMAELRNACKKAGMDNVGTVLATGNVIFEASGEETQVADKLREVVASFGLDSDVFLRACSDISAILDHAPFPDAIAERPNHVLTMFVDALINPAARERLLEKNGGPERVALADREILIDYPEGVASSRLKPAILEKLIGQKGTVRNWNTLLRLANVDG